MKLSKFRVRNFRSINDSGPISVGKIASIVGRNESGKSNLLLALRTLNPPEGVIALKPIKDFPRHRRLSECTDTTKVVDTEWELDEEEQAELTELFPRASGVKKVEIGRYYKAETRWVEFIGLKPLAFVSAEASAKIRKIAPVLEGHIEQLEESVQTEARAAITQVSDLTGQTAAKAWAAVASPAFSNLRKIMAKVGITIPDREDGLLSELEALAATVGGDEKAWATARVGR